MNAIKQEEGAPSVSLESGLPNIMVACSSTNKYIGKDNDLPWKRALRGDLQFLNKMLRTRRDIALVMGRGTYLSMPRKKDVVEIVLSRSGREFGGHSPLLCRSFEEAMEYCKSKSLCAVVFGGEEVYRAALRHRCKVFCTVVSEEGTGLEGDRLYPGEYSGLADRTDEVADFMKELKHDWILENNVFNENGYRYKFYIGYSK